MVTLGASSAAHADPAYPSWEEVQAAQGDAAAKAEQIASIQGYLDDLESRAIALSVDSLEKAENYNQALDALDAATVRVAALEAQADAASESAKQSASEAGQVVAQLARAGGGNITMQLLVNSDGADDLLSQLGTMSKLTERSATIIERAKTDENAARALSSQAERAKKSRETLTTDAAAVLAEAQAASAEAEAKIAAQAAATEKLGAQLVLLTGNADAVNQRYLDGVAWDAAQNAQQPGATAPASPAGPRPASPTPASPAPSNPTPVTPTTPAAPVVTPPVVTPPVVKPPVVTVPVATPAAPNAGVAAAAIAYAKSQLGDAYRLNGAGADEWDCSGLTMKSYASVGVNIGTHSVTNQYNTMSAAGRLVPVAQRTAGDLLFYSTGGRTVGEKYHVAIYIGGGQMIEAPRAGVPVRITGYRTGDLVPYAGRPTG